MDFLVPCHEIHENVKMNRSYWGNTKVKPAGICGMVSKNVNRFLLESFLPNSHHCTHILIIPLLGIRND